jgi:hypothetical protein
MELGSTKIFRIEVEKSVKVPGIPRPELAISACFGEKVHVQTTNFVFRELSDDRKPCTTTV